MLIPPEGAWDIILKAYNDSCFTEAENGSRKNSVHQSKTGFDAVIFDLDGVVTDMASVPCSGMEKDVC